MDGSCKFKEQIVGPSGMSINSGGAPGKDTNKIRVSKI